MGKEMDKVIAEQNKAQAELQQDAYGNSQGSAFDMEIVQTVMGGGPAWYNREKGTVNADMCAAYLMDENGLYRRSTGIYDRNGQRLTDAQLLEMIIELLLPYFPGKATDIARFNVLPVLRQRISRLPLESAETANNGIGAYITGGTMQEEIEAFIKASDIKTNFYQFDKLAGGLYPGLYVIGAISSLGKTTFVQQLADNVAAAGKPVLFFSLEMSRLEMASKSISRKTAQLDYANAISSLKIRQGVKSRLVEQATEAYTAAVGDNLQVIEGGFNTTVESIADYARGYMLQHENSRPVIVVDYLQVLQGAQKGTVRENIDYNVVELKRLARALDVPVIVISSINRGNYLLPVDFESFKESGGIEYTADVVLGLQLACLDENPVFQKEKAIMEKREAIKAAKAANPRMIKLVCLKNRYGRPDWTITYKYYPQYDYFIETNGYTEVNAATLKGAE